LTVGQARHEARKNLGKKHLVYFFECYGSPFAIVNSNKIMSWEEGISDDFHLGRAARNHGKLRYGMFQHALQAATIEESKPIFQRLDWNQTAADPLTFLPSPVKQSSPVKIIRKKDRDRKRSRSGGKSSLQSESEPEKKRTVTDVAVVAAPAPAVKPVAKAKKPVAKANLNVAFGAAIAPARANPAAIAPVRANRAAVAPARANRAAVAPARANPAAVAPARVNRAAVAPVRANPAAVAPARATANRIVETEDSKMVWTCIKKGQPGEEDQSIGFFILSSRKKSFVEARQAMVDQGLPINMDYRFLVPNLGPVSFKQEALFGSMLTFLEGCTPQAELGEGSFANPVKVFMVEGAVKTSK
jgi:hypothetical protein